MESLEKTLGEVERLRRDLSAVKEVRGHWENEYKTVVEDLNGITGVNNPFSATGSFVLKYDPKWNH